MDNYPNEERLEIENEMHHRIYSPMLRAGVSLDTLIDDVRLQLCLTFPEVESELIRISLKEAIECIRKHGRSKYEDRYMRYQDASGLSKKRLCQKYQNPWNCGRGREIRGKISSCHRQSLLNQAIFQALEEAMDDMQ